MAKICRVLIAHLETLTNEAGDVLEGRSAVSNLKQLTDQSRAYYLEVASQLSEKRREAAAKLESAMKEELKELAMPQAKLVVKFQDLGCGKSNAERTGKGGILSGIKSGRSPKTAGAHSIRWRAFQDHAGHQSPSGGPARCEYSYI